MTSAQETAQIFRDQIAALPPERQALVRQMLSDRGLGLTAIEPDAGAVETARQRIANRQNSQWQEYIRSPEPGAHHTAVEMVVTGAVDPGRLDAALAHCLAQWEITRTPLPAGEPVGGGDRPFRSGQPPVRAEIVSRGHAETRVLICGHDLAVDRASVRLLAVDALARYEGSPAGVGIPQFCELLARQAMPDALERREAALRGWGTLLSAVEPAGDVRAGTSWAGRRHPITEFTPADLAAVRELARGCCTSPFAVVLAAWALAAGHLSGCRPPIIGCCLDGRAAPEAVSVIGPLAHPALIVVDVAQSGLSFAELVQHAADRTGVAYRDGEADLDRVPAFGGSRLPRTVGTGVTIGMYEQDTDVLRIGSLRLRLRDVFGGFAKESLRLELSVGASAATAVIEYRIGDYPAAEVAAIGAEWMSLLRRGTARPRIPVARLLPRREQ